MSFEDMRAPGAFQWTKAPQGSQDACGREARRKLELAKISDGQIGTILEAGMAGGLYFSEDGQSSEIVLE